MSDDYDWKARCAWAVVPEDWVEKARRWRALAREAIAHGWYAKADEAVAAAWAVVRLLEAEANVALAEAKAEDAAEMVAKMQAVAADAVAAAKTDSCV